MDLNNLCRVCLSTDKGADLFTIDLKFIEYYNLLTNICVSSKDGMPQKSCQKCWETIKMYITFREKCIKSESSLRESIFDVSNEIKIEVKLTDDVDDQYVVKLEEIKEETDLLKYYDSDDKQYEEDYKDLDWLELAAKEKIIKIKSTKKNKGGVVKNKSIKKITANDGLNNINEIDIVGELPCGLCPDTFQDNKLLLTHLKGHKNDEVCQYCFESFLDMPHIISHRIRHVPVNKQRCLMCNKMFRRDINLEYHIRTSHSGEEFIGLRCKFCSKLYQKPLQLKKHLNHSHNGKIYICNVCSKSCNTRSSLKSHLRIHSDEKKYVCDTCGYSCKFSGILKDHYLRKHAPFKVECKGCKRLFEKQELYDKHAVNCKTMHMCSICGRHTKSSHAMKRHQKTHSTERRFACKRCPARYRSSTALREHNDRHDGVKTRCCEFCSAKFYSASVLVKHRRIHTGEKPYVCQVCNKGFTGKNNLKVHMKVHGEMLIKKKNAEADVTVID